MNERANPLLRFADRYLGIPLIFLLGLFRRKRPFPKDVKRIGLLKTAGIGDLVLLSGIIRDLQEYEIILFTGTSNQEMGKLIPGVTHAPLPVTHPFKSLKILRKYPVDVWIDCDPWPRINAFFSFFSRSASTVGFQTQGQGRHWIYDHPITHSFERHELENYRALIAPLIPSPASLPEIPLEEVPVTKKVVLHRAPGGSQAHLKRWLEERWEALSARLQAEGYEVINTGLHTGLSLRETALLLKESACVISVDTGIMHLAGALGCYVVGLHGPTSPHRWGAMGPHVTSLIPKKAYTPCIQLGFDSKCKRGHCMGAISVEQVMEAFHANNHFSRRKRDATVAPLTESLPKTVSSPRWGEVLSGKNGRTPCGAWRDHRPHK